MNCIEGLLPATIVVADDYFEWRGKVREMLRHHPDWKIVGDASDGWEAVERAAQRLNYNPTSSSSISAYHR